MKHLLLIGSFLLTTTLFSQQYANDWINYGQSYYKFKIAEDGLYRIDHQVLIDAGISVSSIDPRSIQLFAKGEEVPLYVSAEKDGTFDSNDYIEFYGQKNDGWLDTVLYKGRQNQPNPYYSLFNDTLTYFLTWNSQTNNLRYIESNAIDFSNYFKADFIWKEVVESYNSFYYDGEILAGGGTDPEYTPSEGWMDAALSLGQSRIKGIVTQNRYNSGPFANLEIRIAGASNWNRVVGDHHLQVTIGSDTIDRIFEGYDLVTIKKSISPAQIISGNNFINIKSIDDRTAQVDRTALAYIKLTYPHTLSLRNADYYEFLVDDAANQNAQFIELLFFNGGNNPVLYDLDTRRKVRIVQTFSSYRALVPNGNRRRRCVIASSSAIKSIAKVFPVGSNAKFTDYQSLQNDTTYVILTHPKLITEASTYAAYRRSTGFSTLVAEIDQLTDQYGFGIPTHPLAVKNFMDDAISNWSYPISHLLLLGKSVNAKSLRKASSSVYAQNLLPTIGNPAADNLLISGLANTNLETAVPLGRISARSNNEVDIYLDKLKAYEAAPTEEWMKRALHFAGGLSAFQANRHEAYLRSYAIDFEDIPQGGQTRTFRKSTSAPFQTSLADSIRTLVNDGVALLTFFGHASATGGFDISIDDPIKLKNKNKYHVILANACFVGNTHQANIRSTSEQFVFERDKGAIGFIASGNLGLASYFDQYSSTFYKEFANRSYGKSLATAIQETVRFLYKPNMAKPLKSIVLEMALQGDPALVLNAPPQADYVVHAEDVKISPEEVTTDLDSFTVRFTVKNLGKAVNDSIYLQLNREFPTPNSEDAVIVRRISAIRFSQNFEFSFPIDILKGIGNNKISIIIDAFNEVQELSETNNRVDIDVLVRSGEIIPVYPYNFSLLGNQNVVLRASTAFAFEEEKSYVFEIDTSADFSSPTKQTTTILSSGGLIEWKPNLLQTMVDSSVYFWRVSPQPSPGEAFSWRQSSFQYIKGEEGWSQDHFDQFQRNKSLFIKQNRNSRQLEFTDNKRELFVKTIGNPPADQLNDIRYMVDADTRERGTCFPSPAFLVAVIDSVRLESWVTPFGNQNKQNDFGQANVGAWCFPNRNRAEAIFNFQVGSDAQMFAMRDFLNNSIPDGNYVIIYNWLDIDYSKINAMDSSILKSIANLGSAQILNLKDQHPFIFTVKKGDLTTVMEVIGDSTSASIELRRDLASTAEFGEMTSEIAGPSNRFSRFSYSFSGLEKNGADSVNVELIGIDRENNSEDVLFSSNMTRLDTTTDRIFNNSTYDRLRLRFTSTDNIRQTPAQLRRWQFSYQEAPDLAISPNLYFKVNKDTLSQGERFEFEVAVQNISKQDMDSTTVAVNVLNANNELIAQPSVKIPAVPADSNVVLLISIPTFSFVGTSTLVIQINPDQLPVEQHSFNNTAQYDFFVTRDKINPLLDVTFDGRRIINGEIVSAQPMIHIRLEDENNYVAIDDTSSLEIYLKRPDATEKLLNYGEKQANELRFIPATLPENQAQVIYTPLLEEDGIYQLKVIAKDKSGNLSGRQAYKAEFEVVNKSTVTRLLNYPNPFSTSTRFVFTLTGNEIPDQIQIQIMTVTGKVVREIDQNELGPIHIGTNLTDFKWDGKDKYGDQLANGVYLYRVKMKLNGNAVERRESELDEYFKKEFGKMYLLR